VDARHAARLRTGLHDGAVRAACDPAVLDRLAGALATGQADACVQVAPHGTTAGFAPAPGPRRRIVELDRHGAPLAALRWTDAGALAHAWVRLSEGGWLAIEPGGSTDAPWGLSDRVWHAPHPGPLPGAGHPLTLFAALDYAVVDRIPTLADPARLPRGGGGAILNLLAALAADQQRTTLAYAGPYPTEQLFLALLESFRYVGAPPDPLAAFMAGDLAWRPAPHERTAAVGGLACQLRQRLEKVVWRGRTYVRPDWQGVRRHEARRLVDRGVTVVAGLWALGAALEEHLLLASDGTLDRVLAPPPPPAAGPPLPPDVAAGVVALVVAGSTPALGPFIRATAGGLALVPAPLTGALATVGAGEIRVSSRLLARLAERLRAAPDRTARAGVTLLALREAAAAVGDGLRAAAQARLAALPPAEQEAALATPPAPGAREAREIADAVARLLATMGAG
jgi:hypothetical protein